jgi:predicted transposase YbfD/YdcC
MGAMLSVISIGLLCGGKNVKDICGKCGPLNQKQRAAIGLMRRSKKSGRLLLPSYSAVNQLLPGVDPAALAKVLNDWLVSYRDSLPKSLALDGKVIGKLTGGLITLSHHATGAPAAQLIHHGEKDNCEQPLGRKLIGETPQNLERAVITADALHTQKKTARGEERSETRYFITSLDAHQTTPAQLRKLVREHWSIEVKNHWRRDENKWFEDRLRHRVNRDAAFSLSLLRGVLLALMEGEPGNQNDIFERCDNSKAYAMKILNSKPPIPD